MRHNYLISVFVDGKSVNSYFSENLDDLVTIKALHKNCEIQIYDLDNFVRLAPDQVEREIIKSGQRWKKSLEKPDVVETVPQLSKEKPKKEKRKKCWERPVLCVETGQVFSSIRECCDKVGIPYMTIMNCIKNKNATRGVHFVNAPTQ
jgi:hypothetical protein